MKKRESAAAREERLEEAREERREEARETAREQRAEDRAAVKAATEKKQPDVAPQIALNDRDPRNEMTDAARTPDDFRRQAHERCASLHAGSHHIDACDDPGVRNLMRRSIPA